MSRASPGAVIAWGLLVLVLLAFLSALLGGVGQPGETDSPTHDKLGAFIHCQQQVLERLKAPATAQFPRGKYEQQTIYLGNFVYEVYSWVDSENSFGAMIRTRYVCRVRWVTGSWRLVEIEFE